MHLSINSTTGGLLELSVPPGETIEGLTTSVSHRLGLSRDRIAILHKDRQLNTGKLLDQGVSDGSRLTLVPNVEAGLTNSRTDRRSMMQALESLTEAQIGDFLSGRSPLTLALGIGTHVMYVQLQLAAQSAPAASEPREEKPRGGAETTDRSADSPRLPCPPETTLPCSRTLITPVICQRPSRSVVHTSSSSSSSSPLPSPPPGSSPPSSPCLPVPASAPCGPSPHHPAGSASGHQSPAPASTFPENSPGSSPSAPGAVIESFVNHSPGVFSGTFSGTLAPVSQTSVCHPRRGISVILQILSDLLSATSHHQGAPNSLPTQLHCSAAAPGFSASPPPPALGPEEEDPPKMTSGPPLSPRAEGLLLHHNKPTVVEEGHRPQQQPSPPTNENVALRCKLEQLRSRLHQRRVRRHRRCCGPPAAPHHPHHHHHPSSHLTPSPGPHPYLHRQPHSLLHSPGRRQRSAREEEGGSKICTNNVQEFSDLQAHSAALGATAL